MNYQVINLWMHINIYLLISIVESNAYPKSTIPRELRARCIGAAIGLLIYSAVVYFLFEPYTLEKGIGLPEYRLVPGIYAAAAIPPGMFIFGYASKSDITWVAPTVGIALYAAASYIVSKSSNK